MKVKVLELQVPAAMSIHKIQNFSFRIFILWLKSTCLIWNSRVKNSITNLTINLDTLSQRTLSICAISSLGTLMIPYSNFRCPGQLASQFSTELHIQYTCGWIMVYVPNFLNYNTPIYIRRNLGTNRTFYSNRFAILRSKFLKNQ